MANEYKKPPMLPLPARGRCRPQRPFTFNPRSILMTPNEFGVMPNHDPDPWHYVICCFASEVADDKLDRILTTHTADHPHNCILGIDLNPWSMGRWARKQPCDCTYDPLTYVTPESAALTWEDDLSECRTRVENSLYALMSGFFGRDAEVIVIGDTTKQGKPFMSEVVRAVVPMAKGWGVRRITHIDDDATDDKTRAAGKVPAWERDYEDMQRRIRAEICAAEAAAAEAAAEAAAAEAAAVCLGEAIASDMAARVRVVADEETFRHVGGTWRVDDLDPNEGRHRELTKDELRALMAKPLRDRRKSDDGLVTYFV